MTVKCAQAHREHYPVGSASSSKTYPVKAFRDNELPSCTCVGFMTKRNKLANQIGGGYAGAGAGLAKSTAATCKHLKEVLADTCDWVQKPGEQMQLTCPKCLGPTVEASSPRLSPGRGKVPEHLIPASSRPATLAGSRRGTNVNKPATRTTKKAAPTKLPDPKALIKIAQELSAKSDADPAPKPEPVEVKTQSAAEILKRVNTAKKAAPARPAIQPDNAKEPFTQVPAKAKDPIDAAAALAALLKEHA